MVEVGSKNFQNQAIRLTDLAVVESVLEGYRFSNCTIHGPAIVAPLHEVGFESCAWDSPGGLDGIFWLIEDGRQYLVGAIGLVDTIFVRCRFQHVGIAATAEHKMSLAAGFLSEPPRG